jgi:hypothetical protein
MLSQRFFSKIVPLPLMSAPSSPIWLKLLLMIWTLSWPKPGPTASTPSPPQPSRVLFSTMVL